MEKNLNEFSVTIYGKLEKYNEVLSKARLRIFYKYGNRNGTYITDEFAEKLLSTLPYSPIKGIYDPTDEDYTDHGEQRCEGRIYGIVPFNPNISWEDHMDSDGVIRNYACADVLIFTGLYKEASDIVGKSQSMELYSPSLKYHEGILNNKKYVIFDEGCFLGLQVLGDKVEPCFEGASFYTLQNEIESIIYQIKNYRGIKMHTINFRLSDQEKFNAIWALINTEYNEENGWAVTYGISAIYDDYALVNNYQTGEFERIYYKKGCNDLVEISARKKCFVVDVTEEEKTALDTLRQLNGNTYELVNETLLNAEENLNKNSEYSLKIEELNTQISTLNSENEELKNQVSEYTIKVEELNNSSAALNENINSLNEEINGLKEYKLTIENTQKESIISEYSEQLSDEILNSYRDSMSKYSVEELDMHLAYELKKSNSSVFSKNNNQEGYVPKTSVEECGINAILSKYKNK